MLSPLTTHNLFHTVEGWVALGTLALALATAFLAFAAFATARRTKTLAEETKGIATETKALTDETKKLADHQLRALQTSVKPTLIPVSGVPEIGLGVGFAVWVSVQNVGSGLALLQDTRMRRSRGDQPPDEYGGTLSVSVLPPGSQVSASFLFEGQQSRLEDFASGPFWVEIDYADAAGDQEETVLLHIEHVASADKWRVVRVQLQRKGGAEPYASSGWGAIR
jgi:hypothetical protein